MGQTSGRESIDEAEIEWLRMTDDCVCHFVWGNFSRCVAAGVLARPTAPERPHLGSLRLPRWTLWS